MRYEIPLYPGYLLTNDLKIIGKGGAPLTFSENQSGHKYCNVYVNGKSTILYLHRAVALVHVDGYFEGAWVDHKDDNPRNNLPDNLRWTTSKGNNFNNKDLSCLNIRIKEYELKIQDLKKMIDELGKT